MQDAGAITPNATELLDTPGVIYAPYDLTNSTFWFTWNYSGGGFETQAEAAAAFHTFLQRVSALQISSLTQYCRVLGFGFWGLAWHALCMHHAPGGSCRRLSELPGG